MLKLCKPILHYDWTMFGLVMIFCVIFGSRDFKISLVSCEEDKHENKTYYNHEISSKFSFVVEVVCIHY